MLQECHIISYRVADSYLNGRPQADTEEDQADFLSGHADIFSQERARKNLIAALSRLHLDRTSTAEHEIASAADTVQLAEEATEEARATGSAQSVIKKTQATTRKVRKDLEEKRRDLAAERVIMLHIISILGDDQYGWPLATETNKSR